MQSNNYMSQEYVKSNCIPEGKTNPFWSGSAVNRNSTWTYASYNPNNCDYSNHYSCADRNINIGGNLQGQCPVGPLAGGPFSYRRR